MKKLYTSTLISYLVLLVSCLSSKDYVLDSDYSYKGRFNKYKTYDFLQDDNTNVQHISNELVQKTIQTRLGSMGYFQQSKKPDLLITYKFYYNDVTFLCYDQPEFNYWVKNNLRDIEIAPQKSFDSTNFHSRYHYGEQLELEDSDKSLNETTQDRYIKSKKQMKEGMIHLTFFDAKRNNTVWSGYMSGIFHDNKVENERFLRASIGRILDDYKVLAQGYSFVQ